MAKIKQILLTILCVSILLSFSGFVIYRSQQYEQYKAQVFGHSFSIDTQDHASRWGVGTMSTFINYRVTEDGILCELDPATEEQGPRHIGELLPFQLSHNNFDLSMDPATVSLTATQIQAIREQTLSTWKCATEDGELFYLILQENGDIFMAHGTETEETTTICHIVCLNDMGT